jgi:hypothetical protein
MTLISICNAIVRSRRGKAGEPRRCRRWATPGHSRCALHGSKATGPTSPQGLASTIAAMKAGRARWLKKLKAAGQPIPFGRKPGGKNRTAEEREQAALDAAAQRELRRIELRARQDRRARRQARRDEQAILARQRERFHARDPDWYDTDLLDLALEAIREGGGATRRDLAQLKRSERTFVERLRDNRDPPAPEAVERAYARLVRIETALGGERVAELKSAYDDWHKRREVDASIVQLREMRERGAIPVEADARAAIDKRAEDLRKAIAHATLVREAGRNAGARMRGVLVEPEPRHRLGGLRLPPR